MNYPAKRLVVQGRIEIDPDLSLVVNRFSQPISPVRKIHMDALTATLLQRPCRRSSRSITPSAPAHSRCERSWIRSRNNTITLRVLVYSRLHIPRTSRRVRVSAKA